MKVVTKRAGRCVQLYTNAYWYRVSFVAVTILHVRMHGRTKRHKITYRTHDDLTLRWRTSFVPRVKHCWYCTTNDSARMLESTDWAPAATSIFQFLWQNLDLHSPEDHVSSHARTRSVPTCFVQMNRTTVPSLVQTVNSRAAKASTLGRGIVQETMLQHRNRPVHYRKSRYDNKTSGHFRLKLCSDNDTVPVDDPTESKMTWLVRFSYGFTTRGGDQYPWGEHNKLLANV